MAEQRVVVEGHLRIEGHDLAVSRGHQRIDLDKIGVRVDRKLGKGPDKPPKSLGQVPYEPEPVAQLVGLERGESDDGVDLGLENLLGCLLGDLLDLDPTLGRGHHHVAGSRAIHQDGEIELTGDVDALLHI